MRGTPHLICITNEKILAKKHRTNPAGRLSAHKAGAIDRHGRLDESYKLCCCCWKDFRQTHRRGVEETAGVYEVVAAAVVGSWWRCCKKRRTKQFFFGGSFGLLFFTFLPSDGPVLSVGGFSTSRDQIKSYFECMISLPVLFTEATQIRIRCEPWP